MPRPSSEPAPGGRGCVAGAPLLSPADAAGRPPRPLTPAEGRAWRRRVAHDLEAGLRSLWDTAAAGAGLREAEAPSQVGPAAPGPGQAVATPGLALACVGSLARREAGPGSDLDLVMLIGPTVTDEAVAALAERLWYPLWDAGIDLDHSVRTVGQCRTVASQDLHAALGLLDLRHVAGDSALTRSCASALLADWRRATRRRLPELAMEAERRAATAGTLVGLVEPDLREAHGGLRDAVLVRALAASSLADRPHGLFDRAVDTLLNLRDALALVTGRPATRLNLAFQDEVAQLVLGPADGFMPAAAARRGDDVLALAYEAGQQIGAALDTTMRAALRAARPARLPLTIVRRGRRGAPVLNLLAPGVAALNGEVVLADGTRPEQDAVLPLRVALASVRSELPVSAVTRGTLSRCPVPAAPWSGRRDEDSGTTALDMLIELLGAGEPLVQVWEDLDLAGLPARWLPGWDQVRNRPQHNPVHRHTVDRHMVRAAAVTGGLLGTRDPGPVRADAGRPRVTASQGSLDHRVLLLTALLHDLGKVSGVPGEDHPRAGAERLPAVLDVLGVTDEEAREITLLTRHHLLLVEAAARPPGQPEMVARFRSALGAGQQGRRRLSALRLLTEADARAAGPRAWTPVRASIVDRAALALAEAL